MQDPKAYRVACDKRPSTPILLVHLKPLISTCALIATIILLQHYYGTLELQVVILPGFRHVL